MLIDGYWLQIQDSRMQPRHCANYRPTDTLSIEWWQTGWLLSGNKDRAFLLSCGQTTWTPGFSGFWKSLNHHITIIKSSSMNEDSKECSTTVCIQWHASVIVAEKTLTKLAAAGGHELVRQGCFFCLAGALLVPLSTWLSFTANPHTKCFSRKNTHMQMSSKHEIAYLVQDWIFAKKNTIKEPRIGCQIFSDKTCASSAGSDSALGDSPSACSDSAGASPGELTLSDIFLRNLLDGVSGFFLGVFFLGVALGDAFAFTMFCLTIHRYSPDTI